MSLCEHRTEFHLAIWLSCYAVFSYHEIKATFYLTNLLEGVKKSSHFSLSLYHLSYGSQCAVSRSKIHSASSEALKNFQPKKTRKLLRRFRKKRGWSSEDTKFSFTDNQVFRRDLCLHKSTT